MRQIPRKRSIFEILLIVAFAVALLLGLTLGLALAATRNISMKEQFGDHKPALPTKILDIKDREITEFFGDQNRELVTIDQVPQHLPLTRCSRGRTAISIPITASASAGSCGPSSTSSPASTSPGPAPLTQQLAGRLYANRADISLRRKLVELWWAVQMERRYTKQEILLMYLNEMPFGHNTQGVQAASKFFFKHPVQEDTLAESVMLVIQLAKPGLYYPIRNPQRARKLQRQILDQMVGLGYVAKEEADSSFNDYWSKYDYTRPNSTAYFERQDKAPWFSEYIRNQLDELLFGSYDILTDGLVVHTTLDLDDQKVAEERMKQDIEDVNSRYLALASNRINFSNAQFLPMIDMLGLSFNVDELMYRNRNATGNAKRLYAKSVNPIAELMTSLFSMQRPQDVISAG